MEQLVYTRHWSRYRGSSNDQSELVLLCGWRKGRKTELEKGL
jgi:hypothetical protein